MQLSLFYKYQGQGDYQWIDLPSDALHGVLNNENRGSVSLYVGVMDNEAEEFRSKAIDVYTSEYKATTYNEQGSITHEDWSNAQQTASTTQETVISHGMFFTDEVCAFGLCKLITKLLSFVCLLCICKKFVFIYLGLQACNKMSVV